ncbi:MAG: PEGA domain-containing protein [Spirochaetes bacterium]|nr:PEGA domain-containing protein [Spirochaetota bacterium]
MCIGSFQELGAESLLKEPVELRLGVTEFFTNIESPTMRQLGQSVGRMFVEKLQGVEKKRIHPIEREGFIRGLIKRNRVEELKKLDELLQKRDQLALSSLKEKEKSTYIELTTRIYGTLQRLRTLESVDPLGISLEQEEKPLRWIETNQKGDLLPYLRSTYKDMCKVSRTDYLVTGVVEEVLGDILSVRVVLFSDIAEMILYEQETMGTTNELETLIDQLIPNLVTVLLGGEWGTLEVEVQPNDAGIFLNGKLIGIGKVKKPYLPVGVYRIEIQRPGYQFITKEVPLSSRERKKMEIPMEAIAFEPFQIVSLPPNATFYLGAERKGDTPFFLAEVAVDSIGRIEKEGYKAHVFPLKSEPQELHASLPKDLFPWKERIERKREDFYKAFGWFVLSLPLPILLYGYYENESFRYIQYSKSNRYDPSEAGKWSDRLNSIYYGYLGTLFLSSSFLVNAIVSLMDYLQTGEASVKYPDQKP